MKATRQKFLIIASLVILLLAWVGSAPPLAAQDIEVTSADPPEAEQGTVNLDVTIKGKGFDRSAKAKFFLTGTENPGGVTVNSTRFVSSTELVANIDVAVDAVIATRDIVVQARKGRTGKGTELFSVTKKSTEGAIARAAFRDYPGIDRIQSDGEFLRYECQSPAYDYHYADFYDPCQPGHRGNSKIYGGGPLDGQYFLRTTETNVPDPTRYLVLDFTERLAGSECLDLDWQLSDYEGRAPYVDFPPVNPDPCIDWLEVRFFAHKAFKSGAQFTTLDIRIDGPDLIQRGRKKSWVQWSEKWLLQFVNPLTINQVPGDPNTVTLSITVSEEGVPLDEAELWTIGRNGEADELVGTYSMPFEVTITKIVP